MSAVRNTQEPGKDKWSDEVSQEFQIFQINSLWSFLCTVSFAFERLNQILVYSIENVTISSVKVPPCNIPFIFT